MNVDLQAHPMTLTLGTLVLTVSEYQLKMNTPVIRHTLCDGSTHLTLLPEAPCTLTVSGTLLRDAAAEITDTLEAALAAHTAFSFTFRGTAFVNMQITALDTGAKYPAGQTAFQITLTGGTAS